MKEAKQERQELNWQLAYSRERDGACSDWMPASVPGCVQLDTAAARGIPLYYTGDHEDEYRWMEPLYWHYRAQAQIEMAELLLLQEIYRRRCRRRRVRGHFVY